MLTEKDYCDYKLVLELKELGYDYIRREGLIHLYDAQKWLREEKKIEVLVLSKGMIGAPYDAQVYTEDYVTQMGIEYSSYEEALLEGIKEAVEILKDEQTN